MENGLKRASSDNATTGKNYEHGSYVCELYLYAFNGFYFRVLIQINPQTRGTDC